MDTNERVFVGESRGVSPDLKGAMLELAMLGRISAGTKTLFHAIGSPSPDEEMDETKWQFYWKTFENEFDLGNQPFIEVQHRKKSRDHRHRVYSLVTESGRLIQTGHNYRRNELVSRLAEVEFGHKLIQGRHDYWVVKELEKRIGKNPYSPDKEKPFGAIPGKEQEQANRKLGDGGAEKFRTLVYHLFEEAERDWISFAKRLDAEKLTVARGHSALMVVDISTGYNAPLARVLNAKSKDAGKPIRLKSAELEGVFGKAKPLTELLDHLDKMYRQTPVFPIPEVQAPASIDRINSVILGQSNLQPGASMPSLGFNTGEGLDPSHQSSVPSAPGQSVASDIQKIGTYELMNQLMTRLQQEQQRRVRLERARTKKESYGQAAFRKIGEEHVVIIAAQLWTRMRKQKISARLAILTFMALAHANALVPILLVAAAAVVIRSGLQNIKASQLRSDADAARAAKCGFRFDMVDRDERRFYAALAHSSLLREAGSDPCLAIEILGFEKAACFLAWWSHASDKQREVIMSWTAQRSHGPVPPHSKKELSNSPGRKKSPSLAVAPEPVAPKPPQSNPVSPQPVVSADRFKNRKQRKRRNDNQRGGR